MQRRTIMGLLITIQVLILIIFLSWWMYHVISSFHANE
jgi:hypothetical protein